MGLIALAIAPGLAICLFIFHRDEYNREPKLTLTISFLLGAASIIPAIFIEKAFWNNFDNSIAQTAAKCFFLIAITEEMCKFLVLRIYSYNQKSFDEPLDGIVHGVVVSMGFATVENILYVQQHGYATGIIRMFLSVPAHATFGVLMGYYAGMAKFNPGKSAQLMLLGILWAVIFHGAFDTLLLLQQSPEIDHQTLDVLLFLGAVASFAVALWLSFSLINKRRHLSQQTYAPLVNLSLHTAMIKDIPLIRNLTYKVWPQTYSGILSKDQIDYMLEKMYSEASLLDQMQKQNHEFIIVYNGTQPVGFASYSLIEPGIYKLHKIYILPSEQGKGTGKFLIDQLSKAMTGKGAKALQLNVNRNNKAKEFYEKLGFVVLRSEDINIGNGYFMNDYVMEKKLSS
jgi:RsiW-degrading membrane proteinase PrsW (M82 family)/ribosomal protein S18 acetylase RimI-like enzyme